MSDGISITGLDELIKMCEDMEISEQKQRKALNIAGNIILEATQENAPDVSGYTKDSIKKKVSSKNNEVTCEIASTAWDSVFTEYGSSKNKKYIGWFSNSVESSMEEAINAMKEVILNEK